MPKEVGGIARIAAPIESVWDYITQTEDGPLAPLLGGHPVDFDPVKPRIEQGMRIKSSLEAVGVRGLVVVRIDTMNDDRYNFDASVIEAPLGIKGGASVELARDNDEAEETDLRFSLRRLPLLVLLVAPMIQKGIDESMPGIGKIITRGVKR